MGTPVWFLIPLLAIAYSQHSKREISRNWDIAKCLGHNFLFCCLQKVSQQLSIKQENRLAEKVSFSQDPKDFFSERKWEKINLYKAFVFRLSSQGGFLLLHTGCSRTWGYYGKTKQLIPVEKTSRDQRSSGHVILIVLLDHQRACFFNLATQ